MTVIKPYMAGEFVTRHDLLPISFLEKSAYTGSKKGLRYKLEKVSSGGSEMLRCFTWKTPLAFDKTPAEDKSARDFEFSDDGIDDAIDYLNSLL